MEPQSNPQGTTSSQTGGQGTPVQVENIQYNVNVGKVKSKVGFAGFLTFCTAWVGASLVLFTLLSLKTMAFSSVESEIIEAKEMLVFIIALAIPVIPLFIFLFKRLEKLLRENSINNDDISYKKTLQMHMILSIINSVAWVFTFVYTVLTVLLLESATPGEPTNFDSIFFAFTALALTAFFWHFQKQTKR
jgi:hypothetical protein